MQSFDVEYKQVKKMKKRRELDALVNGKTNGRKKRKGQQETLLDNMSDSSENEEFSVSGNSIAKKYVFCFMTLQYR